MTQTAGRTPSRTNATLNGVSIGGAMNLPTTAGDNVLTVNGHLGLNGPLTTSVRTVVLFGGAAGATQNVTGTETILMGGVSSGGSRLKMYGASRTVRFGPGPGS